MSDRRSHPRLDVGVEAEFRRRGAAVSEPAAVVDVSATGASLLTETPLPLGAVLTDLSFTLPAGDGNRELEIRATAEAVREQAVEVGGGESRFSHRTGVQFVELEPALAHSIQLYVFRALIRAAPKTPARRTLERQRIPVERPIAVRYENLPTFIEEMSANLSISGMFIQASRPRPPRSEFEFEMRIGEDFVVFSGRALVVWVRERSKGPDRPRGMGVRFVRLDEDGRAVIERLVQEHLAAGAGTFDLYEGIEEERQAASVGSHSSPEQMRDRISELEELLARARRENETLQTRLERIEQAMLASRSEEEPSASGQDGVG